MAYRPVAGRPAALPTVAGWTALWGVVAAAEFAALLPLVTAPGTVSPLGLVYRLVGGSFAACGLIAWHRRPDNRSGFLLTVAGLCFFLFPLLSQIHVPTAQTLAMLANDYWTIPFVALLLTYVTGGRLGARVDRALVGLFVLSIGLLQFVWLLFYEDKDNVLVAFPSADAAHAIDRTQRWVLLLGCLGTFVVVAARYRRASPPRRRALWPSVAGAVALLLFASLLLNDLLGTGTRSPLHLWIA